MGDIFAYAVIVIIPLFFLSGFSYYTMLFVLKSKFKNNEYESWSRYRSKAKPFETELMTTYKIIMDNNHGVEIKRHDSTNKLVRAARCNLYFSMSLFMLVLALGLYVSVKK
jgi:IS1 family transposase